MNGATMKPNLHPWLNTPEAAETARKAVHIPLNLMPHLAVPIGADELYSEALAILTECALPPRDTMPTELSECGQCGKSLADMRKGAKFCSRSCKDTYNKDALRKRAGMPASRGGKRRDTLPDSPGAHIGSMWAWPEGEMSVYAIREVGYVLNNWLRTGRRGREVASSDVLANMDVAEPEAEVSAREFLADYLDSIGVQSSELDSFAELAMAAIHSKGTPLTALAALVAYMTPVEVAA